MGLLWSVIWIISGCKVCYVEGNSVRDEVVQTLTAGWFACFLLVTDKLGVKETQRTKMYSSIQFPKSINPH